MSVLKRLLDVALIVGCLAAGLTAHAAIITRSITIDGNISDWTSPTDITTNAGQFSSDNIGSDCPTSTDRDAWSGGDVGAGSCDGLPGGVGRDLKTFSFTYDSTNVYLFVERFASSTNVTDWWFYIDGDNDGFMGNPGGTDVTFRVKWQGSNQNTDRELWTYTPVDTVNGDVLISPTTGFADGYDMPGTISNRQVLASFTGGTVSGVQMESFIPWSTICGIGCSPQSIRFHISSSNGSNLPTNIVDNMDGPGGGGGGAIVILDLSVEKSASVTETVGTTGLDNTFTYTVTVANEGGGDATGVSVTDDLGPIGVTYVTHSTAYGTYTSGTGLWDIGDLDEDDTATLTLTVSPDDVGSPTVVTNTADTLTLNESDTDSTNNEDEVDVTINPSPDLTITKSHVGNFTVGLNGTFSIVVGNDGPGDHTGTLTVTDTLVSNFTFVSGSGTGWSCGAVGQNVTCTNATTLAASGTLPTLTLTVNPGTAAAFPGVSNTATVTAAGYEDDTADNSATDTGIIINPAGNLQCYAVGNAGPNLTQIDSSDLSATTNETTIGTTAANITGIAYNCANGTLYAVQNGGQFGSINAATGAFTTIGSGLGTAQGSPTKTVTDVRGIAYDATSGALYGIHNDGGNDILYLIDPGTGEVAPNGYGNGTEYITVNVNTTEDIAVDPSSGTLYGIDASVNPDQVVTINKSSGTATNLTSALSVNTMVGLSSDNGGDLFGTTSGTSMYFVNGSGTAPSGQDSLGRTINNDSNYQALSCIYSCTPKTADLSVTKVVNDASPDVGDTVTFTVTVQNGGADTATQVQLNDDLPPGVTYVSDTPSQGGYDDSTGIWFIGSLSNGASATLTIDATIDTGQAGNTITNTASVEYLTQIDSNATNDSDSIAIVPVEADLSTSTKSVVDLNGGNVNPGDILRYTITLTESGGTDATNVTVQDDLPDPTYTSGLTLVSKPTGSLDTSAGSGFDLEVSSITIPANSSETVVFDVTISATAPAGTNINNTVTITNPIIPIQTVTPSAPTVTVIKSGQTKNLYLGPNTATSPGTPVDPFPALSLGRLPFTSTTGISIAGAGGSQTWALHPALSSNLMLDGTAPGVSVPVQLILSRGSAGPNRSARFSLDYSASPFCTGLTNIGTSVNTTVLSGGNGPTAITLSFNLTPDATVPSTNYICVTVTNNTAQASRTFSVHPTDPGNATSQSQLDVVVFDVISVDSVTFYDGPNPTGSAITEAYEGDNVYFRTTISDPFGAYDITNAALDFRDPATTTQYIEDPLTLLSSTTGSKTFEGGPYTMPDLPIGIWDAFVTATEGTEGLVEDIGVGSIELKYRLPVLTVDKSADKTEVASGVGEVVRYTITVTNDLAASGTTGKATLVVVEDNLGEFTNIDIDIGGAAGSEPFIFTPGTSGLTLGTPVYSDDDGVSFTYTPLTSSGGGANTGYDGNVTDWRIPMTGTMTKDGAFIIEFEVEVD